MRLWDLVRVPSALLHRSSSHSSHSGQTRSSLHAPTSANPLSDRVEQDNAEPASSARQSEKAAATAHAAEGSSLLVHLGQVHTALRKSEPSAEEHATSSRADDLSCCCNTRRARSPPSPTPTCQNTHWPKLMSSSPCMFQSSCTQSMVVFANDGATAPKDTGRMASRSACGSLNSA